MMSVRMVQNAAMISAIARTVRSIADFQKVVDINAEDAEVEEAQEVDQKMVLKMVNALEGLDVMDEEVHHLGKRKPVSVFLVIICTANILGENRLPKKIEMFSFDKCALILSI